MTMTREEAIDILRSYLMFDKSSMQIDIALNMAIEALSAEAEQGCDGCRYNTRIPREHCLRCKRYWRDSYERKGGDDE